MQTWEEFLKENYELSNTQFEAYKNNGSKPVLIHEIETEYEEYIKSFIGR